jgi:hypothetical protein
MPITVETDKMLIWDNQKTKMVTKTRVAVSLLGNRGSVYNQEGPIYVETPQEISEAVQLLKYRLIRSLPGLS